MLWRSPLPTFAPPVFFTAIMSTDGPSKPAPAPAAGATTQQLPVRTTSTSKASQQENGTAFELALSHHPGCSRRSDMFPALSAPTASSSTPTASSPWASLPSSR
jgi:hypothetical protein